MFLVPDGSQHAYVEHGSGPTKRKHHQSSASAIAMNKMHMACHMPSSYVVLCNSLLCK